VGAVLLIAMSSAATLAASQENRPQQNEPKVQDDRSKHEATVPVPPETNSVTKHDLTLNGQVIHYTATAGNLLIRDDQDHPNASIFYVAYTQDGADARTRPITFFFNGGPGAATIWLHMGSFGPVRVETKSPEATGPAPYRWVPNEYSLLDKSDLVFIDAPLCGFSRAVGKGTIKDFAGTDQDIRAFRRFIERYVTANQRWSSPKFLFGESYGTTRAAGLAAALQNDGMPFNGVVLLSSILNYAIRNPGYDAENIGYLPSFAAIGYYYKKVKTTEPLSDWVEQAREFARGPYAQALSKGDHIPQAEFDSVARDLSALTGLKAEYLKQTKLRIAPGRFREELLRDDSRTLGRYDARFMGWDPDAAGETPGFDPSDTGISGAFLGAFHDYIQKELKYMSQETYYTSGPGVNQAWDFKHEAPGQGRRPLPVPDTALDLADAMRKNPSLKVFSANGYFDLATPFFATEYDLNHMSLPPQLARNVEFGYYPAGHMVYLNVDALRQMKADLLRFYTEARHN
jgi:carboxypeptidase C (cathepsin A)